jgi:probable phosphoglycerate mutase
MSKYPELYILRHGETEWNAEGRMQGALNSPLTAVGRTQAQRQGAIMRTIDLTGFDIISSPQGRAFETAAIALARQVNQVHTDPALCEIGLGAWSGELRSELSKGMDVIEGPDGALELYEQAPQGEGFVALEARCMAFLDRIKGPSVLITHGITSRMLRVIATGSDRSAMADIGGGQGVVFHLKNDVQKRLE